MKYAVQGLSRTICVAASIILAGCATTGASKGEESEAELSALSAANPPTVDEVEELDPTPSTDANTSSDTLKSADSTSTGKLMLAPTPAEQVTLFESGQPEKVYWGSLEQEQIRALLDQIDEEVTVEQIDSSGRINAIPASASINKGIYRVTYSYYRFRNQPCADGAPASGGIAIGIGLRVIATVQTMKAGVEVTDLIPLAAAAERNEVRGRLRVQAIGISSATSSVSSYLQSAAGLSADAIRKAVESFGVVKAVSETTSVSLSPNYLYVDSPDAKNCLTDLNQSDN